MATRVEAAENPSIGALIDQRFKLVAKKVAAEEKVKAAKTALDVIEERVFDALKANGNLDGARGKTGMVTKGMATTAQIEDFDSLLAHMKKTGHFDLLQKRVAVTAVKERWEAGESVPGVRRVTEVVLHWTAAKS